MPRFPAVPGLWSLAHLPVNGHAVGLLLFGSLGAFGDDADGAVYDEGMRIDVASFSGDILKDVYALGAAVTFTNLAITAGGETVIGDGSLEMISTSRYRSSARRQSPAAWRAPASRAP